MKNLIRLLFISSLVLGLLAPARAAVETYTIDPVHSTVQFSLRHVISRYTGSFTKVSGAIQVDRANLENSSVEAVIDVGSISTASDKRNDHLKSPDFFDVAKYATITFKSTAWKKTGEDTFDVTGNLTIKDVTKPVVLKVTLLGFSPGMRPGSMLSGWEVATTLRKSEFNLAGPATLAKALGEDVTISIGIEAGIKPAGGPAAAAKK
jgi:polyisoprenoid-binding protein YceI